MCVKIPKDETYSPILICRNDQREDRHPAWRSTFMPAPSPMSCRWSSDSLGSCGRHLEWAVAQLGSYHDSDVLRTPFKLIEFQYDSRVLMEVTSWNGMCGTLLAEGPRRPLLQESNPIGVHGETRYLWERELIGFNNKIVYSIRDFLQYQKPATHTSHNPLSSVL